MRWLSEPPSDQLPEHAAGRLSYLMSSWPLLWQVNRQRLLRALIEELRWDGKTSTFTIVLNEDRIVKGHGQETDGGATPETWAVEQER